jgi:protein required for attachment to host cells
MERKIRELVSSGCVSPIWVASVLLEIADIGGSLIVACASRFPTERTSSKKEFQMTTYQSESEMVDVMLNRHTWVLVADSEKALFLCNKRDMSNVQLSIIHQLHNSNPATREQGTDKPGRLSSGPGLGRSAVEDTDWHEISKKRFAKEIADALYCHAHKGEFERLIIVAPPLMLGEMRQEFHKEVGDKIVSEIPKTLTNHSTADIQAIVEES